MNLPSCVRIVSPALTFMSVCGVTAHSGAATIPATSCAQSAVQAALSSAAIGDTILVPPGACTWSGITLPNTKKITLQGAGAGATVITGDVAFGSSGSRVTGFTFTGAPELTSNGHGFRLDHNTIHSTTWRDCLKVRDYAPVISAMPHGLVDHNQFTNCRVDMEGTPYMFADDSGKNQSALWALPLKFGSADTVYVEDNTFELTYSGNFNAIDANYGGSFVARYNTLYDGLFIETHSSQEGGNRSGKSFEVYGNIVDLRKDLSQNGGMSYRMRGGTGFIFYNRHLGTWANKGIPLDNVRSYAAASFGGGLCNGASSWDGNQDTSGWPCRDQIGRGSDNPQWTLNPVAAYAQPAAPAYFWANKDSATGEWPPYVISWSANHIKANRDYYAYAPSFNGTSGVGCGTLAARPATCTVGTAYWVTNQSCSDISAVVGAGHTATIAGTLHRCAATNTWTVYYQPLVYPHPAVGAVIPVVDAGPLQKDGAVAKEAGVPKKDSVPSGDRTPGDVARTESGLPDGLPAGDRAGTDGAARPGSASGCSCVVASSPAGDGVVAMLCALAALWLRRSSARSLGRRVGRKGT